MSQNLISLTLSDEQLAAADQALTALEQAKKGSGSFKTDARSTPRSERCGAMGQCFDLCLKAITAEGALLVSVRTQCLGLF